jgi:glycosyltransferase involved in cell wall biosynthesis
MKRPAIMDERSNAVKTPPTLLMNHRVLIITYHFPPRPTMAAARLKGLAKYLPEFGWEPVVLTPRLPQSPPPAFHVVETPYPGDAIQMVKRKFGLEPRRGLQEQVGVPLSVREKKQSPTRKFTHYIKGFIAYPDDKKYWRPYAVAAGLELLQKGTFDAMLSSFGPPTAHLIANELKSETGLPWVADFRDLWTQNHYYAYSRLRKWFESRLEAETMAGADALVTVSRPLADRLAAAYPNKPVFTIPNGFDPEEISQETPTPPFTITYTGQLYWGKRDPKLLFQALQELIAENKIARQDIRIHFYGPEVYWLDQETQHYGLEGIVRQFGPVSREEAVSKQRTSQILLLLRWDNPDEVGVYTGKLFEYLAAKRPILALGGPEGVVSDLLAETGAGVHATTLKRLKMQLASWYQAYQQHGVTPYTGDEERILSYSHRAMAKKFAEALNATAFASSAIDTFHST